MRSFGDQFRRLGRLAVLGILLGHALALLAAPGRACRTPAPAPAVVALVAEPTPTEASPGCACCDRERDAGNCCCAADAKQTPVAPCCQQWLPRHPGHQWKLTLLEEPMLLAVQAVAAPRPERCEPLAAPAWVRNPQPFAAVETPPPRA